MKKKFILSLLPIALVLGGLGVAKYNARENAAYDEIEEDTLEHAEVFGGTNFLEPKVRKAYVDPIAANYTTIGVQTQEEANNKMSIRFVGLVKIVDKNGNGMISDELSNTRIIWRRGIFSPGDSAIKDYAEFESEKVYKSLANGGGSYTVESYNAEHATSYTHFVTYALRNAPKNFAYVNASFRIETKNNSADPIVSKTVASSLNGAVKFSIDTSAIENGETVMIKKTASGFETIRPIYSDLEPIKIGDSFVDDYYARFESDFKNGESFIIVRTKWVTQNRFDIYEDSNTAKFNVNTGLDGTFTKITEDKPCVILWTQAEATKIYGGSLKTVDFKANDDFKTAVNDNTIDNFKLKVSYKTKLEAGYDYTVDYDAYYNLNKVAPSAFSSVYSYRTEVITASCDNNANKPQADIIPYNGSGETVTDPHTEGTITIDSESTERGYLYDSDNAWKNLKKINVRVQPEGYGKAYIASGTAEAGSKIGLVAEPLNGNKFVDWRDNGNTLIAQGETCTFDLPANADDSYTITANFEYSYAGSISQLDENGSFTFGLYPQTVVTDQTLISALDGGAGTDAASGYKLYNGVYYVKQEVLNPGRLENDSMKFNNGNSFKVGDEYWFVVEPITWDVGYTINAKEDDHRPCVVSQLCLDQCQYNNEFTDSFNGTVIYNFMKNTFYSRISSFTNVFNFEWSKSYPFDIGNTSTFNEIGTKKPFKITDYARAKGVSVDGNGKAYAWLENLNNKAVYSDQLGNITRESTNPDLNTSPMAQYIGFRPISVLQGVWCETGFVKERLLWYYNPYNC